MALAGVLIVERKVVEQPPKLKVSLLKLDQLKVLHESVKRHAQTWYAIARPASVEDRGGRSKRTFVSTSVGIER